MMVPAVSTLKLLWWLLTIARVTGLPVLASSEHVLVFSPGVCLLLVLLWRAE